MKKTLITLALLSAALHAQVAGRFTNVDATQGYTVNGGAPNNFILCGNGSRAVFAASCGTTANPFYQIIQLQSVNLPQRFVTNYTGQFSISDPGVTLIDLAPTINSNTNGNAATATNAGHATNADNATTVGGVGLGGLCQSGGAGCPPSSAGVRTCNANGCYRIAADGTIEQWGVSNPSGGGGVQTSVGLTFPTPFTTTANLSFTATATNCGGACASKNPIVVSADGSLSTFGVGISFTAVTPTGGGGASSSVGIQAAWHAIGN